MKIEEVVNWKIRLNEACTYIRALQLGNIITLTLNATCAYYVLKKAFRKLTIININLENNTPIEII